MSEVQSVVEATLRKPQHIISLATSAMLVAVDISVWTATKQDRETSDEITTAKKADKDAGRFVKHLLGNNMAHKRVVNYRQTIYNWLQRRTYEWSASQRLLPVIELIKFMQEYKYHEQAFNELVEAFLKEYPTIVSNMAFAAGGMGELFRREDYPTVDEVRGKFGIFLYTSPVPESDYRCQISKDLADDLHNNYFKQAQRLLDSVLMKQMEQLTTVMESLSHCCDVDTVVENGETKVKRRKIYETTVQKAQEMVQTFKEFNVSGNPDLEFARESLEKVLDGITIGKLKESDSLRVQVKSGVDAILDKFRPKEIAQPVIEHEVELFTPDTPTGMDPEHEDDTVAIADHQPEQESVGEEPQELASIIAADKAMGQPHHGHEPEPVVEPVVVVPPPPPPAPVEDDEDTMDIKALIAKYTK